MLQEYIYLHSAPLREEIFEEEILPQNLEIKFREFFQE